MENTICIIENLNDVKILKNQLEDYPNLRIFTLDYSTHKILEKNRIIHEFGENFLNIDDKKSIDEMAVKATLNWWKTEEIKKLVTVEKIIIPEFIEMELFQYFLSIFKNAKMILKIINDVKPNKVIAFTNLNLFLESICKNMNIKFNIFLNSEAISLHYDKINIKYNLGTIPLSITISRQRYKMIKNISEKVSQKFFSLNPKKNKIEDDSILLLEFNPTTYETLLNELGTLGKNVYLLNQRRPAVFNKKSLEIVKKTNCKIIDLSSFEKKMKSIISTKMKLFLENLEKVWSHDNVFEKIFKIESYTLWDSIKPIFSEMCNDRFVESYRRILLLDKLFHEFKISQILEWAETGQEEKEVLAVSKKFGIKSIMLQHSMFPISEVWKPFGRFLSLFSHEFQSEYQVIWGDLTMKYAISNGLNKEKLLITGSPRHDPFFLLEKNSKKTGKILLATSSPPAWSTADLSTNVFLKYDHYVKEIFRVIKKYPDKQLVVKPHPQSDFMNNAIELINETDSNAKIILDANLPELINDCDLVIGFNTSTILLESLILQKPTISLITDDWAKENEIMKMNAVMIIDEIDKVESGISKILSDKNYEDEIKNNSKKFLDDYLSNHEIASEQLVKTLKKI